MPKVAAWSDAHVHPFKAYASISELGVNSRLQDGINCVNEIADKCNELKVDLVLFGGDLFHERKTIPTQALYLLYDAIQRFSAPIVGIPGNHDQADKLGNFHSLHALQSDSFRLISSPRISAVLGLSGDCYSISAFPYAENRQAIRDLSRDIPPRNDCSIFLGHFGIQGAVIGSDFVYQNEDEAEVSDLNSSAFDLVLLGHFHKGQQLAPNMHYIGSPLQHNWGDAGDETRGFVVYDTETKVLERIPLSSPKFIKIDKSDLIDKDILKSLKGNFVRVNSDEEISSSKLSKLVDKLQLRSLEIMPTIKKSEERETRLQTDLTSDSKELIRQYVNTIDTENHDVEYLIAVGAEILQEAERSAK